MVDPLTEFVALLEPSAAFSKTVSATGVWRVRRAEVGRPFYCVALDGACRLLVRGHDPLTLQRGDFVLIPAADDFTTESLEPPEKGVETTPIDCGGGEFRMGPADAPPDVRMLVGYCQFASEDAALLVPLLPQLVHVRGESRLAALVRLVADEARAQRPGREVILARLLEVLLIEALRATDGTTASPGLVRGLGERHVAAALRRLHAAPMQGWTVTELAKTAGLSRSTFFERFSRAVGLAPMEYLLAWRMALAKSRLRRNDGSVAEIARDVGYGSGSAFSVAFSRHVGIPPARYAREQRAP